jgi:hypothetical protein
LNLALLSPKLLKKHVDFDPELVDSVLVFFVLNL